MEEKNNGSRHLDIASFIKSHGASPKADLTGNHAFLLTQRGWSLSPMFDVNPEPAGNELSLNVDEKDRIDLSKLKPIIYDEEQVQYLVVGEKVADAFRTGMENLTEGCFIKVSNKAVMLWLTKAAHGS